MAIYLITYDLRKMLRNYTGLIDAIKGFEEWWHYLDNTWLINTSKYDANEIFERLKPHVTETDNILVVKINKDYQGWLPKEAWSWINERI